MPRPRKPSARQTGAMQDAALIAFFSRLWRCGISFNILAGIFMLAVPALAHAVFSRLLPHVGPDGTAVSVFFTVWIGAVLLYAAAVSIAMWRAQPPRGAGARVPKAIATAFFVLSLLYALYLFASWVYLDAAS